MNISKTSDVLSSVGVSRRILNMTRLLDEFEIANLFLVEGSDDQLFLASNTRRYPLNSTYIIYFQRN